MDTLSTVIILETVVGVYTTCERIVCSLLSDRMTSSISCFGEEEVERLLDLLHTYSGQKKTHVHAFPMCCLYACTLM